MRKNAVSRRIVSFFLVLSMILNMFCVGRVAEAKVDYYKKYKQYMLSSKEYKGLKVYKYIATKVKKGKIKVKDSPYSFSKDVKTFKKKYSKLKKKYKSIAKYINNSIFDENERRNYAVPPELIAAIHFRENENDFIKGKFEANIENGNKISRPSIKKFKKCAAAVFKKQKSRIINCKIKKKTKDIVAMCAIALYHNGMSGTDNEDDLKSWKHSAYVFSGTSLYEKGKYVVDGQYNYNIVDKQVGVFRTLDSIL